MYTLPGRPQSRQGSNSGAASHMSHHLFSRSPSRPRSERGVGNSSMISLPDLLQEAEAEVINKSILLSPPKFGSGAPFLRVPEPSTSSRSKSSRGRSSQEPPYSRASRLLNIPSASWSKEDWKIMERCFVRERKLCAERMGLLSSRSIDPGDVDLKAVADRFIELSERSDMQRIGPDFERYVSLFIFDS